MNKLTLLCLVALALIHNVFAADYCTAKVVQVESAGSWDEAHLHKRVVDLHIVNDHSICSFSESVTLSITPAAGGILGNLWGIGKDNIVSVGDVQPGKVHGGLGLVYSGAGQPTIAVTAFGKCVCGDLGPQNPPTTPPAVTPAPTPAPGPTTPPTEAPEAYYTLGLKFAILTCNASADIRLPVAKNVLGAVGSSYTVFNRVDWGTSPLELENADGSGKFYAMVATVELACWTSDQVAKINAYNIKNHVKMVILYTNAYATNGVSTQGPEALSVTDTTTYVTFASAMLPSVGPLVHDAHIPIFGVYLNKAKIDSPALAKAALNLKFNGQDYIAAAFITYDDGRNHLEFYMDSADWATFPTILGTAWLNWVTNGVFAGSRRIEFNAHMDDIFMMTGTFNPETGGEDESTPMKYRITPLDLQKTLDWQNALNDRLTEGSHVVLTFPYNGATVKEKGGFQTDDLFIKAKALRDDFIWESHTWSHPYLTNLSYDEVTAEYQKNIETLAVLFDVANTHESINKVPNYCSIATITPSITGLFNPDAMQAMYDFGIRFVVGDNSRAELIPYTSLYHVLHSNVSTNGVDGINIVPRHATNIYYDGSLPEHITDQFNFNYAVKLGHDFTFDEIVQRDMQVAVKNLLLFRHDPFMFHQANLRFSTEGYESGEHSLLSYWVDTVLDELEKYISLPIISRKHEDLGQLFLDREDRDNCGFEGTLKFLKADHSVVGIKAKSTGTCSFGISGVETEDKIAHVDSVEYYGEEKTTWLKMEANEFDVYFLNHVQPL